MNRSEFKKLSARRVREASILLANRQYSGAYYLAGYAVECGLKACIARQVRRHEFPNLQTVRDSYTHDLRQLVRVAGLEAGLEANSRTDPTFRRYWATVKDWKEDSRYRVVSRGSAQDLLGAVADPGHGVITWLQHYW